MSDHLTSVLLIEDSPSDARLLREMLRMEVPGLLVETHERLAAGIARLAAGGIDLVLLDLGLPDGQGVECFQRLHGTAPSVPVIVLTGLDDQAVGLDVVRAGAQDYVVKGSLTENVLVRVMHHAVERHALVQELHRTRMQLEHVLGASPAVVYSAPTTGEPVPTFVSPNAERIFGHPATALMRDREFARRYVHPEDLARILGERVDLLREGRWTFEYRMRDQYGVYHWFEDHAIVLRDEDGQPIELIGCASDVTERKQAEDLARRSVCELAEARDAALAANRAKSEFLANVSHEMRTPMNGVIGMTGLLLDTPLTDEQTDYATTVRTCAESLLSFINDLLDLAKIEAGKMSLEAVDFDLRSVVEEVADLLAPAAHDKRLELLTVVPPGLHVSVHGDAGRVRQILVNLAGNAVKFTANGEVRIEVRQHFETATHLALRLQVVDTGIGIVPERQAAIFESFTQGDGSATRQYGGSGLGLTICRQLAELMDGKIGVESAPGQGSTFWVDLTFERRAVAAAPRPESAVPPGLRALLVDDSAATRAALAAHLRAWGLVVEPVGGVTEALSTLDGTPDTEPFGLVLFDVDVPLGGAAGVRALRAHARTAGAPVVPTGTPAALRSIGGDTRVAVGKPIKVGALRSAVERALGCEGAGAAERSRPEPPVRVGARVLVVEDDAINQRVAVGMLARYGCRADAVGNGREALEALARVPYDLVLMDVEMPEMDGLEATAAIRSWEEGTDRHLPIVALTGHVMPEDRERCRAAGMDECMVKPIDPKALLDVVQRWVGRAAPRPTGVGMPTSGGVAPSSGR